MISRARHDSADAACDDVEMQHRRTGALVGTALLLTLAACGTGSDGAAPPATDEPAATSAPAEDGTSSEADTTETDTAEATATAGADPAPAEGSDVAEQPVTTEAPPAAEEPPTEPVVTEAPAPAEPVLGGRLFASEVQPASAIDTNPFPDLVVDDIGKDARVNIRNILPSDRPVLLWAWAPH